MKLYASVFALVMMGCATSQPVQQPQPQPVVEVPQPASTEAQPVEEKASTEAQPVEEKAQQEAKAEPPAEPEQPSTPIDQLTPFEKEILTQALTRCPRYRLRNGRYMKVKQDPNFLAEILMVERDYDIPEERRGILLAVACWESAYKYPAKGDCVNRKKRIGCKGNGLFQQWPWFERRYGFKANLEPYRAAEAYLTHIAIQLEPDPKDRKNRSKVEQVCPYIKDPVRQYEIAQLIAVRSPGFLKRAVKEWRSHLCHRQTSKHIPVLRPWHRNIERKGKYGYDPQCRYETSKNPGCR